MVNKQTKIQQPIFILIVSEMQIPSYTTNLVEVVELHQLFNIRDINSFQVNSPDPRV